MAAINFIEEAKAHGKFKEIYKDSKRFFGLLFVPNKLFTVFAIWKELSDAL